ncbi:MAG: ATP-binding protein [Methylothermaceae bacterium]|nr:ATP-binding protein [Methylothermaceae bacterium]
MRTLANIEALLPELDHCIADDLEDQDLDFKQWDQTSRDKAIRTVVQMAVCMANGGGGTVVFGVADRIQGRSKAILGVPPEIDVNLLKKAVYDQTDPKIMPVFEELAVPDGTGRLLLMQIYPGMPPLYRHRRPGHHPRQQRLYTLNRHPPTQDWRGNRRNRLHRRGGRPCG